MIDSSLISATDSFPADAALQCMKRRRGRRRRLTGPRSECSAVSVRAPPPDVTVCPSVCRSLRSPSISSNRRSVVHLLCFTSPSISTHLFIYSQRASACLFVRSATVKASSLRLSWRNAICTCVMCDTAGSTDAIAIIKCVSLLQYPWCQAALTCALYFSLAASTSADECCLPSSRGMWEWDGGSCLNTVAVFFTSWIPTIASAPCRYSIIGLLSMITEKNMMQSGISV